MNTATGDIKSLLDVKKLSHEQAKWFKEIPKEFVELLKNMSRKERRKFYFEHKKEWNLLLNKNI